MCISLHDQSPLPAGVLHCWFVLHKLAKVIIHHQRQALLFQASLVNAFDVQQSNCNRQLCVLQNAELFWLLLQSGLQCCLVCLPVLLFQLSGWLSFCYKGIVERPWCFSSLPNIYRFVQSFYWGVGFLRYFKVQQVCVCSSLISHLFVNCVCVLVPCGHVLAMQSYASRSTAQHRMHLLSFAAAHLGLNIHLSTSCICRYPILCWRRPYCVCLSLGVMSTSAKTGPELCSLVCFRHVPAAA